VAGRAGWEAVPEQRSRGHGLHRQGSRRSGRPRRRGEAAVAGRVRCEAAQPDCTGRGAAGGGAAARGYGGGGVARRRPEKAGTGAALDGGGIDAGGGLGLGGRSASRPWPGTMQGREAGRGAPRRRVGAGVRDRWRQVYTEWRGRRRVRGARAGGCTRPAEARASRRR